MHQDGAQVVNLQTLLLLMRFVSDEEVRATCAYAYANVCRWLLVSFVVGCPSGTLNAPFTFQPPRQKIRLFQHHRRHEDDNYVLLLTAECEIVWE